MTKLRWILVGGDSLLGKEVRDLCEENKLPVRLVVCGSMKDERVLTEEEGELAVLEPLEPATFAGADAVLLAAGGEAAGVTLEIVRGLDPPPAVVDLAGALEEHPLARLRAPLLEQAAPGLNREPIHVIADPAASCLARLLQVVHVAHRLRRAVVTVLEPASTQGRAGIDELHKQTVSLFSFQQMPQQVFDTQVSFNLLPRYGEQAPVSLASSGQRVERHLASMLGQAGIPLPSVRLIQAPVFHGCCQSVWLEFENRPSPGQLELHLREQAVEVRGADVEPVSNVGVAGSSGISVSDIAVDPNSLQGMWLWLACDNVRTIADHALIVAGLVSRRGENVS